MSLLLYAVVEGSLGGAAGDGIDERPLQMIGEDGLVALVTEHDESPALTEATLWKFEHVIESQMAYHTVVPARFGTLVKDAVTLERILRRRRDELNAQLQRIRGAVELGVRSAWPIAEPPAPPTGPDAGTAYMLARVARDGRARELAARMDVELGGLARAARYRLLTRPTVPVTAAYLVDSDRTDEFVTRVWELDTAVDGIELVCTGPWPPYSFVGGRGDD